MIKADHKYWARLLYNFYVPRLLKSNFQNFYLVNEFPEVPESDGLIITPNHFSWWDGFFIDFLLKKFSKRNIHLLMLEEQLKRYWFFQKVGAFSINPSNPVSTKETFDYIVEVIKDSKNVLLFYPQGEIEDYFKRPLKVKEGLKSVLNMSNLNVKILPIAFKIKHGNTKKPDVLVRFGNLLSSADVKNKFRLFVENFRTNVDLLDKVSPENYKGNLLRR
jgi:1-acyl-sn-glycerol-3-phosphate acyltransferase